MKEVNIDNKKIWGYIAMMECYQQGFKDCWKALTGKDF